jgi:endonuclease-3 related protein
LNARALLASLLEAYGSQDWWPADSAFEVMVGAVLVQRTTWRNAAVAIDNLRTRELLSSGAICEARHETLEALIRPAGFFRVKLRRLLALARFVEENGGTEGLAALSAGSLRHKLVRVHGVGEETADAILLYAFDHPVWVSDAYSRRILQRLDPSINEPAAERRFVERLIDDGRSKALAELHALLDEHGKRRCRRTPECVGCPLVIECSFPKGELNARVP